MAHINPTLPSDGDLNWGDTLNAAVSTMVSQANSQDDTLTGLPASTATKWLPNTPYVAGQAVINPSGFLVNAKANFTSTSTYSATDWNDPVNTALSGAVVTPTVDYPALGRFFAGLAARNTTACNIVFTGSSTTAGTAATDQAHRYVNVLGAFIQSVYPSSGGSEAAVVTDNSGTMAFGTPSTAPGVHIYNGGIGGTTSANYLTDGNAATIASLNPAAVFHMIGANDFAANVTPATYKTNVLGRIAKINSLVTKPLVHILIQSYARYDGTFTYAWSSYGTQLKAIADADPTNVAFIDLSPFYIDVGIPSTDTYSLMYTDHIHQVNDGHAFMARLIARSLNLGPTQAVVTTTSATPNKVSRLVSDTLNRANGEIVASTADGLLGGQKLTWVGDTTGHWAVSSNALVSLDTTLSSAGFAVPAQDLEASFDFTALSTTAGASIVFNLYSSALTTGTTPDRLGLVMPSTGNKMTIVQRVSSTQTTLWTDTINVDSRVGHRLSLRYTASDQTVRLFMDGSQVSSAVLGTAWVRGGYTLFTKNAVGGGFDNFSIDVLNV